MFVRVYALREVQQFQGKRNWDTPDKIWCFLANRFHRRLRTPFLKKSWNSFIIENSKFSYNLKPDVKLHISDRLLWILLLSPVFLLYASALVFCWWKIKSANSRYVVLQLSWSLNLFFFKKIFNLFVCVCILVEDQDDFGNQPGLLLLPYCFALGFPGLCPPGLKAQVCLCAPGIHTQDLLLGR